MKQHVAVILTLATICGLQAELKGQEVADQKAIQNQQKVVLIQFGTRERPKDISPSSESYFERKLKEAKALDPDVLVLEIDSPGGYVESSVNMAATLRDLPWARTVAYIPREALSGAAIISLGADEIIMHENADIGDAGPIFLGQDFMFRHAPEKIRSDLVAKVRGLSEDTGRPPAIAEAMVDMDLEVFKVTHAETGEVTYKSQPELEALDEEFRAKWQRGPLLEPSKQGQFLEVQGEQAVDIGLANGIANSREALAKRFTQGADELVVLQETWIDRLAIILNSPFVVFLLLIVGLMAVYVELAAPGIGVGALLACLCFGLFFWSQFLGGTAGWLEVTLFLVGIVFLLLELFVIPGFGVAGITGILLMAVSLLMATQRFAGIDGWSAPQLIRSLVVVSGASVASFVGMYVLSQYFGGLKLFQQMRLEPPAPVVNGRGTLDSIETDQVNSATTVTIGDEGIADCTLRPSGRVLFGDAYLDVVTDGSFVEKGAKVRVIRVSGTQVTVREIDA